MFLFSFFQPLQKLRFLLFASLLFPLIKNIVLFKNKLINKKEKNVPWKEEAHAIRTSSWISEMSPSRTCSYSARYARQFWMSFLMCQGTSWARAHEFFLQPYTCNASSVEWERLSRTSCHDYWPYTPYKNFFDYKPKDILEEWSSFQNRTSLKICLFDRLFLKKNSFQ